MSGSRGVLALLDLVFQIRGRFPEHSGVVGGECRVVQRLSVNREIVGQWRGCRCRLMKREFDEMGVDVEGDDGTVHLVLGSSRGWLRRHVTS
ncbi:hypothetical protein BDV98DRAFT_301030 [Pterulicium gracile]|uniref:Uncharacterized protein n=1 Tax=Pterulicium gracile TaxID=1884261 RepID=A0A5C3Q3U6_9AGAR|nr:hypothetical protein BDV98DRAFT_301030 [Pterula gracilis]